MVGCKTEVMARIEPAVVSMTKAIKGSYIDHWIIHLGGV